MTQTADRYSRQTIMPEIGPEGQARLGRACVVVIGCGALGTCQAQLLARGGVGRLRLVDRDFVELHNLHRQVLYDEADAAACLPKAEAAARHLRKANSTITVEPVVADVTPRNVENLLAAADLALDATDNLETRYLLNDACVKLGVPWVYGGAIGVQGTVMPVRPGLGPCLRCLLPEPPPAGALPTCDQRGVLNAVPAAVAAIQVAEAFKLLLRAPDVLPGVLSLDLWKGEYQVVRVARNADCPCCGQRRFPFLNASSFSDATSLCGRNAVQITPGGEVRLRLDDVARRLAPLGPVANNDFFVRFTAAPYELVIFPDGRTMVRGTTDPALARSLYARYIGI